jgi:hypothetical protein
MKYTGWCQELRMIDFNVQGYSRHDRLLLIPSVVGS